MQRLSTCNSKICRRDELASDCQHSQPVTGFLALSCASPNTHEQALNCATNGRWFCLALTQESAPQGDDTASLPVYLFWAVSGVTLAKEQMVTRLVIPAAN